MEWSTFTKTDNRYILIHDDKIDRMNHELFQRLYHDGYFKSGKLDRTLEYGETLVVAKNMRWYIIDNNYIKYKMKLITEEAEKRGLGESPYIVHDVGPENFLYDPSNKGIDIFMQQYKNYLVDLPPDWSL